MLKLIKILKFFEIKNKFLKVITNNANNNNTLKDKLNRVLNRQKSQ